MQEFFDPEKISHLVNETPLFTLAILLLIGYVLGAVASILKLPEITGYILAGLLLGESGLHLVAEEMKEGLRLITSIVLGMIAFTIGGEFALAKLKRMGMIVVTMTLFQIGLCFLFVTLALLIFKMPLENALLLGAIATATDATATVAIVQSLRAKGRFVEYLYGLVALDDAGCVIVFGITSGIVIGMLNPSQANAVFMVLGALNEIFFSILLGSFFAVLSYFILRKKKNNNEMMIIILGILFLETALANVFHLSSLLSNMALGAVLINISPKNHRLFRTIEPLAPPIYALFFIIAGIELNISILLQRVVITFGLVFVVARAIGKYSGVWFGAYISRSSVSLRRNLGVCMIPQAGVSLGLALFLQNSVALNQVPGMSTALELIINITLFAVFINELIGPALSGIAVKKGIMEKN